MELIYCYNLLKTITGLVRLLFIGLIHVQGKCFSNKHKYVCQVSCDNKFLAIQAISLCGGGLRLSLIVTTSINLVGDMARTKQINIIARRRT